MLAENALVGAIIEQLEDAIDAVDCDRIDAALRRVEQAQRMLFDLRDRLAP